MEKLKIYHLPGACSRVTLTALEHVGLKYEDYAINLIRGEQKTPEFLAINPRGKIPALIYDGKLLTENAAIISWLHSEYPEAGLFPQENSKFEAAQYLADLFWISAGWHPYVRANMMPMRWTVGDPEDVRAKGRELLTPLLEQLNSRLSNHTWYYGEDWAITDVYFYWCYVTAETGGFSLESFPMIGRHKAQVEAHASFQAALKREDAALERDEELKAMAMKLRSAHKKKS